jgi:hypothetical protein
LVRSTDKTFTPASPARACVTPFSQPPQVMPVTTNRNSFV